MTKKRKKHTQTQYYTASDGINRTIIVNSPLQKEKTLVCNTTQLQVLCNKQHSLEIFLIISKAEKMQYVQPN
jgi:hypothetical protein